MKRIDHLDCPDCGSEIDVEVLLETDYTNTLIVRDVDLCECPDCGYAFSDQEIDTYFDKARERILDDLIDEVKEHGPF